MVLVGRPPLDRAPCRPAIRALVEVGREVAALVIVGDEEDRICVVKGGLDVVDVGALGKVARTTGRGAT